MSQQLFDCEEPHTEEPHTEESIAIMIADAFADVYVNKEFDDKIKPSIAKFEAILNPPKKKAQSTGSAKGPSYGKPKPG